MIVIPAIDLHHGRCVRLSEGRVETATVYGDDPVEWARRFVADGAVRLHVVDLDGAFDGAPRHAALIADIARAVPAPIQVGGGLRDLDTVAAALATGARWAILGTGAALEPRFLEDACRRWPGRVLVSVDAVAGQVAVDGWTRVLPLTAQALAHRAAAAGAGAIIYTDVHRDGTGRGPNLEATATVARDAGIPVIASGGVAGIPDLVRLSLVPGVAGAIVGRALYTGGVGLRAALAAVPA
jgi:phosphoribosylformimino-5-aminoimidazole carboxamide ribotide isomerase